MPTIRYHEFRPGRWVKLVDGKAVGPASAEEVAAWKRELAGQAQIWEDVLKHATPSQATDSAPQPEQTSQADETVAQPATPPAAVMPPAPMPLETQPTAEPALAAPPPILRTVEDIRSAKVITRVQVTAPAPQPAPETEAPPPAVEETPTSRPAAECAVVRTEQAVETAAEAQLPPPPAPESESPQAAEAGIEPTELAAPVEEVAEPAILAAPVELASAPGPELPEPLAQAEIEPAVVTLAAPRDAEAPELVPEAATPHDQDEEAEAELEEEPSIAEEETEADDAAERWEEPPEAEPAETATEEGPQEASETEPQEEALSDEDAPRPYVRRSRSAARAAEKRKGFSSRDIKGPEYLWFVTAPTDDLIATVRAGLSKYQERFSQPAGAVLCHAVDLPALEQAELGVDVRESKGVPAHNFWIGPK